MLIGGADFTVLDDFKSMYNVDLPEVKKKDESVSTSPEEVMGGEYTGHGRRWLIGAFRSRG